MDGDEFSMNSVCNSFSPAPPRLNRSESMVALDMLVAELSASATDSLQPEYATSSTMHHLVEQIIERPQHPEATAMKRSESELALNKLLEELSATATPLMPQFMHGIEDIEKTQHPSSLVLQVPVLSVKEVMKTGEPQQSEAPAMNQLELDYAGKNLVEDSVSASTVLSASQSPTSTIDEIVEVYKRPQLDFDTSVLRAKLDMACAAAAAIYGASSTQPEDLNPMAKDQGHAASHSQLKSQVQGTGYGLSMASSKADHTLKRQKVQMMQTTNDSSEEDSGFISDHIDCNEAKRAKRRETNRESARSYRQRKREETHQLETKIDRLLNDNAAILRQFADMQKKQDAAAVENDKLKTEIEKLRAKVNKAEKVIECLIRLNPMLLLKLRAHSRAMQSVAGGLAGTSANVTIPEKANSNQSFHQWRP